MVPFGQIDFSEGTREAGKSSSSHCVRPFMPPPLKLRGATACRDCLPGRNCVGEDKRMFAPSLVVKHERRRMIVVA